MKKTSHKNIFIDDVFVYNSKIAIYSAQIRKTIACQIYFLWRKHNDEGFMIITLYFFLVRRYSYAPVFPLARPRSRLI